MRSTWLQLTELGQLRADREEALDRLAKSQEAYRLLRVSIDSMHDELTKSTAAFTSG